MVQLATQTFTFPFPFPAHVYAVLNKYPNPLAPHVVSVDVLDRSFLEDGTIRSERLLGVRQDSPKWVSRLLGTQDVTYVREVSFVVPSSLPCDHTTTTTSDPDLATLLPSTSTTNYHLEPPKLLMASTNLTLSHIMQCREAISYLPHPWPSSPSLPPPLSHPLSHPTLPQATLFSQSALIYSTGLFAATPYPPVGISSKSPIDPLSYPEAKFAPQRAAGRKVETWGVDRFRSNAQKGREAMQHAAESVWEVFGHGGSGKMHEGEDLVDVKKE